MKFNWKFKRLTTAEKLDKERKKSMLARVKNKVPSIAYSWCFSDKDAGYKYIEHELSSINPQQKAEILYELEHKHNFIIMKGDMSLYIVVSEAVAAGREAAGWERVTARKQDLPLPCQGEG